MIYKDRLTMVLKIYALRVKGQCFTLNLPNISPYSQNETRKISPKSNNHI